MAGGTAWTPEEKLFLAKLIAEDCTNPEIVKAFAESDFPSRSYDSVHTKRAKDEEVAELVQRFLTEGVVPDEGDARRIQVERARMDEELKELRKAFAQKQKDDVMFEVLAQEIRANTEPLDPLPPVKLSRTGPAVEEDLVALFSDAHADQIIRPERVLGFEDFGFEEFTRRAQQWVDTIIDWTSRRLAGHTFQRLWIPCLGDNVEGDGHGATKHTTWANTMKAALAVGDVLAQAVSDLAQVFPEIILIGLPGNHPRWAKKLDWRGAHENFDYLVLVQAATRLQGYIDQGRVIVHAPDSYTAVAQIRGHNFLLSHGHEVRSWNGIPWYGLERRGRRTQALFASKQVPLHYHCIGHFHNAGTLQTPAGELVINGNWSHTSEYAFDALGAASKPFQWLFGVHEDYGITWRLPIHVAQYEFETSRYDQRILYDLAGLDRAASGGIPMVRAGEAA